ncbi:MAG TPA: HAMP domain-containing sensor histidine kinase [Candidatus Binataceae bacterium]|nr:HAMP domain-containing sensor histidine kinase [Candidatus Binataceae bacterium]
MAPGKDEKTPGELRQALQARDDFLAVAVHELRNPITPIQLCVEMIRMALQSGDYTKVDRQAERLERLLNQFLKRTSVLLDVTRLTSGNVHLQLVEFDLSQLVRNVIDELSPMLVRSGSELRSAIQDDITCFLDPMSVTQILENLLSNAIKYGEGKPIEVMLSAGEGYVEIAVRDHGVGITEAAKARIFEPFERAVTGTTQSGFGIGLWVSRMLTESLGGSISVAGNTGAGSLR